MPEVIIKRGSMELKIDRSEIVQVDETPDGISFLFKNKFQLMFSDQYMPLSTKNIIKNSADSYHGKKLVFDFDNKRQPVTVYPDES